MSLVNSGECAGMDQAERRPQAPYQPVKDNLGVVSPDPEKRRYLKTQPSPPLGLKGEAPWSGGPQLGNWIPGAWEQVPLGGCSAAHHSAHSQEDPGLPLLWTSTWAQRGRCTAHQLFSPTRQAPARLCLH